MSDAIEIKVGQEVAVKSGGSVYSGKVVRETRSMWVVKSQYKPATELMFKKQCSRYDLNFHEGWGGESKYLSMQPLTERVQEEIAKTNEMLRQRQAEKAQQDQEKKEKDRLQKEWEATEEGQAQYQRNYNWSGLILVVEKGERDRRARVLLVGPYKSRYDQEVTPNYRYAEVYVTQGTDWGRTVEEGGKKFYVTTLKAPEITISCTTSSNSIGRMKQMRRMIERAEEIASAWDKETGKVLSRERF